MDATIVSVVLSDDGKNCLEGVWFNQSFAARRFRYGQRLSFSGKPKWYRDHWQMNNPRVQILDGEAAGRAGRRADLSADRRPAARTPAFAAAQALDLHAARLADVLPVGLRQQARLADLRSGAARHSFPADVDGGDARPAALRLRGVSDSAAGAGPAAPRGARRGTRADPGRRRRPSTRAFAGCFPFA